MTVSRRILLHVAVGAAFVLAVVTAVTYLKVYEALKQRDLQHLSTYVSERTQREEARFQQIQANLTLAREQFVKRLESRPQDGVQAHWDERFEFYPDGAWRSRRAFEDGRKWSQLWAHKNWKFTPDAQRKVVVAEELCNELLPGWVDAFPSVYFNFPGPANIGFDARIPSWVWDMPADYNVEGPEWLQLALPKTPPKQDKFLWTGVQRDVDLDTENPLINSPLVSVFLPIHIDGAFIGSVGHDMYVAQGLLDETVRCGIGGAYHIVFRRDGRLLAHPKLRDSIIANKGLLLAQDSGDAPTISLFENCTARAERQFSGFDPGAIRLFAAARIAGPEWYFVTTMPQSYLQGQARASAQWVLWSGLASLALVLIFIATILRRQITQPLAELNRASKAIAAGESETPLGTRRADELGELAGSFREMGEKVLAREAELRQLNLDLEQRVADRTAELARFARILDLTPDFVAICGMDKRNLYLNSAGRKLMGLGPEDKLGHLHVADFHPEWAYKKIREEAFPTAEREGLWTGELTLRSHDGRETRVAAIIIVLKDADGVPRFGATIMRDLTEHLKAQEELERALAREREVSELRANFVSLVSHEFRTPLEIILTSSDILDRYYDRLDVKKRESYLGTIRDSVKRMGGMMEDVMLLGRVEEGKLQFKPAAIDLGTLCRRITDEMQSSITQRCPIRLEVTGEVSAAQADESLLRHMIANLLSNAAKYSSAGSPVDFNIARQGCNAVFTIKDRGRGIPQADGERLFQSFQRGSNVSDTPGTGLGLLIVKKCVEIHGGEISFQSQEGAGTTFTVTLPLFP